MLPRGFLAAGVHCGIAKKKDKKDLALFYSLFPATAAGMFTANRVAAAPVLVSRKTLSGKKPVRAVVANSGNANACTGSRGVRDAEAMGAAARKALAIGTGEVLVASTGVIGRHLPRVRVERGIRAAASRIRSGVNDPSSAAEAIMTTDTMLKVAERTIAVGGIPVKVWGCAKGSGMIHPELRGLHATMLSFILTDAAIKPAALEKALREAVGPSFNSVTVDGDTSTNDSIFLLANGAAGNRPVASGREYTVFAAALAAVCLDLARMIARDGEGATKLVTVEVKGARSEQDARRVASVIATSPLVKTALFGSDANWGRIIAAAGRSGVAVDPGRIDISFGDLRVARRGGAVPFSEARAKKILDASEVTVTVDLKLGACRATYYTCDLSYDYIKINGSYRS